MEGKIARLTSLKDNLNKPNTKPIEDEKDCCDSSTSNKRSVDGTLKNNDNKDSSCNDDDIQTNVKNENKEHEMKKSRLENKDTAVKNDDIQTSPNDKQLSTEDQMKLIQEQFEPIIGIECTTSIITMLSKWEKAKIEHSKEDSPGIIVPFPPKKGVEDESKYVTLPLIEDKQIRKKIHLIIKSDIMNKISLADTLDKKVRVWHIIFEKQMPTYKQFAPTNDNGRKKREPWPHDRPKYLKFVMYKENIDTSTAIKDITRIARIPPKQQQQRRQQHRGASGGITYAGMKDKRGVTSQYCTVFQKTPQDLLVLNQNCANKSAGGGNTKNHGSCIIRVGEFSYVDRELRLGMLSGNRFDIVLRNVCVDKQDDCTLSRDELIERTTQTLRDGANAMKDKGFVNYFGMQRFGKYHDTHLVGIAVLKGDFKTAVDLIMRVKPGEQERYKDLRAKWENRFNGIDMDDEAAANEAEMNCSKDMLKGLGRFMNCETSIMHSLSRKPRDYKKAFGSIAKHMRSMFLHAYQSYLWNKAASHRVEIGKTSEVIEGDLVLASTEKGNHRTSGLKGKNVQVVSQDDIETGKFQITDVVLPLIGTRIELPSNEIGDLMESFIEEDGLTLDSFENIRDRELALCGDYRKIICKPSDVDFEIKLYSDPLQPLIQTDLMAIQGEDLDCVDVTDTTQKEEASNEKELVAMIIGFSLPSSAYATIALRELMKRPTSAEYQTTLNLGGNCEKEQI